MRMVLLREVFRLDIGFYPTGRALLLPEDCPLFTLLGHTGQAAIEAGSMAIEHDDYVKLTRVVEQEQAQAKSEGCESDT